MKIKTNEAANLLNNHPNIQFELIGEGPEKDLVLEKSKKLKLKNVKISNWMEKHSLIVKISQADRCLGTFGITPQ